MTGTCTRGNRSCLANSAKNGFSMVEVLTAMAILLLMVLFLGQIFRDSTSAFSLGSRQSALNMDGRAVIDHIAQEMSTAVSQSNLVFFTEDDVISYGFTNSWVSFAPMTKPWMGIPGDDYREVQLRSFFIETNTITEGQGVGPGDVSITVYSLIRGNRTERPRVSKVYRDGRPYTGSYWWELMGDTDTLMDNISAFRVTPYHADGTRVDPSEYPMTNLPAYVDIYLALLTDEDVRKAGFMIDDESRQAYVERKQKPFFSRVQLRNRVGYGY